MAIPKPDPGDWLRANAQELRATDKEVLAMLRDSARRVNELLKDLEAKDSPTVSDNMRRAQLETSRAKLLAEQARVFERLGDITAARRARSASRAAKLSAAGNAELLRKVGKGAEGQYLYEASLETSQNAIDVALARMRLSALPLSERIYRSQVWMGARLGKLINETLASGINARDFAKRARDWFNPSTPGGVRYAALRLARTEINNAFHAMTAKKAQETPWIPNCKWHLSGSHPVPDECNVIAERDNGFGEGVYKSEDVPVRPHPQCMCYITPEPIDEDEFIENFLKGDYDDFLDAELEANGWDVKESKPRTAPKTQPEPVPAVKPSRTFESRMAEAASGQDALTAAYLGLERRPGSENYHEMTRDMMRSVSQYTEDYFGDINDPLRAKIPLEEIRDPFQGMIKGIDAAMAKSELDKEVLVFRGLTNASKIFGDRIDGNLEGMEWKEDAYVSTTALQMRTRTFLGGSLSKSRMLMRIILPKGTKAVEVSQTNSEAELLLDRGYTLRVARDNGVDENGIRQIDVELVPTNEVKDGREDGAGEDGAEAGRELPAADPQGAEGRSRTRTDGFVAGSWKRVGLSEAVTDLAKKFEDAMAGEGLVEDQVRKNGPDWSIKMATEILKGLNDESDISYSNGSHRVNFTGKLTPEEQQAFLAHVDLMESKFPTGHDMSINVAPSDKFDYGVGGETTLSTGSVFINEKVMRQETWPGMPISKTVSSALYVLAHEWGHSLSTKDEADDHSTHQHAIDAGGMTSYGTRGANGVLAPREGYAEAFAEWALSEGKTTNPAARAYAEKFKWGERFGF